MRMTSKLLAIALLAGATPWLSGVAAAAPLGPVQTLQNVAAAPAIETVQFRRWGGGWRGRGRGWWGPGFAAGVIGGAILGSQPWSGYDYGYYGPGPAYSYAPNYPAPYDSGYGAAPDGDSVAYCQQRFRSYNPATGTYLGYDGQTHPCP